MAGRQLALAGVAALGLAACANTVTLTPHGGGPIGVGASSGSGQGILKIDLEGEQYTGQWVVSPEGGFSGFTDPDAPATGKPRSKTMAKASNMVTAKITSNGDGRAYANAPDGKTLRCNFRFNAVTSAAQGLCQRSDGRIYDMVMKQ
jgi:hypothetical protein